jgi:hypothetical protein
MIRDKIIEAYYTYRQGIIERLGNPKHLRVVVILSPKAMSELLNEEKYIEFDRYAECSYTSMFGQKTPLILRNDLPENVGFIIQSQEEYERQEKERMLDKFFRMFGD